MAIVLDATPGGATANSYATLAEAETYFEGHAHPEAWEDADGDDAKNRALVTATRLIDRHVQFAGLSTNVTQRLQFPRSGLTDVTGYALDSNVIPERLKEAVCELARFLLISDRTAERSDERQGLKRMKAGPTEFEWTEQSSGERVIPDEVRAMLERWTVTLVGRSVCVDLLRA